MGTGKFGCCQTQKIARFGLNLIKVGNPLAIPVMKEVNMRDVGTWALHNTSCNGDWRVCSLLSITNLLIFLAIIPGN